MLPRRALLSALRSKDGKTGSVNASLAAYSIRFASNRSGSSSDDPKSPRRATSPSPANVRSAASIANQSTRNRKLTPAAKAKAQASASRALREQLQATKVAGSDLESIKETLKSGRVQELTSLDKDTIAEDADVIAEEADSLPASATATPPLVRRIRDVYAYATAESYNFELLIASGRLPPQWQLIEDGNVIYIPHWPARPPTTTNPSSSSTAHPFIAGVGEAFIFRSGSYVTWGISHEQSKRFLRSIIRGRPNSGSSAEVGMYAEIGDEGMEYILAEDQITRVVGDVIVIGQQPRQQEELEGDYLDESIHISGEPEEPDWTPMLARLAFSQGLSRSARLSVQEAALTKYLEEVADMPARLEAEGKVPLPRRQVIRKMGTLLKLRQRANLDSENFLDDPEMYWENFELEDHYDSICQALDIETRFKAYNEKLDHGENLLGVLRALLTESSTHRMELIIIYLIAFEVCLALISHEYIPSPERIWNMVTGAIGGEPYSTIPDSVADVSHKQLSNQSVRVDSSSSTSPQRSQVSYWNWLKNYIPGLRNQNSSQLSTNATEHLV
ncbi:uncharacterized protein FA14DRAFT_160839 [Meira miltonrushii]|uniref:DUF155 domain-containing protein n=1 Tax=Meira miltonrushii TaxID=1280837 RepID=A0A316VHN3_9BASI|nr:uncharacterized protein FA14DRAFT_160839 [Meira miltonrushii]PWN35853.1 hypothetical protein FA14DRAFT_160839 [Meira miltonrushii]